MPMPTGFLREMPIKPRVNFFGEGVMREIFTRRA
jgi:hypothetical protein